jgi:hypothetical protein
MAWECLKPVHGQRRRLHLVWTWVRGCSVAGGRAAHVYWHFDGCPSHLRKKKEIVYEGLTRMKRATPPGTVGVAGSHCVCGQRGGWGALATGMKNRNK